MRSFFEGIETLFVEYLFAPYDFFRHMEPANWWTANTMNWIFMAICTAAAIYWCLQLKLHKDNGEENQDTTAHSFLK